jgi:hypothetical protein
MVMVKKERKTRNKLWQRLAGCVMQGKFPNNQFITDLENMHCRVANERFAHRFPLALLSRDPWACRNISELWRHGWRLREGRGLCEPSGATAWLTHGLFTFKITSCVRGGAATWGFVFIFSRNCACPSMHEYARLTLHIWNYPWISSPIWLVGPKKVKPGNLHMSNWTGEHCRPQLQPTCKFLQHDIERSIPWSLYMTSHKLTQNDGWFHLDLSDEMTEGRRKDKTGRMGAVCSKHGRHEKCIQNFVQEAWREQTTWKTEA